MKTYLPKVFIFLFCIILILLPSFSASADINHVIINEIKTNGTGFNEFIELYNPTNSSIIMNNWHLRRKNSAGTEENLVNNFSDTILAHGYLLIGHGAGYSGTPPLDIIYSAPSNALTNNYSVLLYNNVDPSPIDRVGFGSSPNCETACPSNPPVNSSIERINHQDTDNNSVDFAVNNSPTPQNSSSPADPPLSSPSPTPLISPSPTPDISPSPEDSPSPTPEVSPSSEPSPTLQPSPSLNPTPDPSVSPSSTPEVSPSPTPQLSPSPTPVSSPSITPSPTTEPVASPSQTPSPTIIPSSSPTTSPSPSASPLPSPSSEIVFQKFNILCVRTYMRFKILWLNFSIPQIICSVKK